MSDSASLPDTPERILDAAEALFAERGVEATSMRAITQRAGANVAAVNYHFGSKEGLLQAVLRRRLDSLNARRIAQLDAAEAGAGGAARVKPHLVVQAFFAPAIALAADRTGGGQAFMRLLARSSGNPAQFLREFLAAENSAVMERFSAAFARAMPDVPPQEVLWRFHFMLGAFSYAIMGVDNLRLLTGVDVDGEDAWARLPDRLMAFLLGGLRAPLPGLAPPGDSAS
ncbi:MAG: TetR family transcriptional regulator [Rhodocyclaceae bacterium]|nr:TetR family transcriptional regulator [Rhodocyclaceae bacterium]